MRKYHKGRALTAEEVFCSKFIWYNGKVYHEGWFMNWHTRLLRRLINRDEIFEAVPNDKIGFFNEWYETCFVTTAKSFNHVIECNKEMWEIFAPLSPHEVCADKKTAEKVHFMFSNLKYAFSLEICGDDYVCRNLCAVYDRLFDYEVVTNQPHKISQEWLFWCSNVHDGFEDYAFNKDIIECAKRREKEIKRSVPKEFRGRKEIPKSQDFLELFK